MAEILRSGIKSLPTGQTEAAKALGMRKTQMMLSVLLPQAVTAMMPAIISQMVVALKDTALGYVIGYSEIIHMAQLSAARYGNYIPVLIVIAIILIIINFALSSLATYIERRLRQGRGGNTDDVPPADQVDQAAMENMPVPSPKPRA